MKELKKYRLRASKKPMQHDFLSGVILVRNEDGTPGYAHFAFDPEFVVALGHQMPYGISRNYPAVLRVRYDPCSTEWLVDATYTTLPNVVIPLWRTKSCPDWVQFQKLPKGKHASE